MKILEWFQPYLVRKTGLVNLRSGTTFKAVIWKQTGGFLVLRNAELIADQRSPVAKAVDGEIVVRLADVDFIQVVA